MRNNKDYRNGLAQLQLLPGASTEPDWRVDEYTRNVGRHGVAQALETLRGAAARGSRPDHSSYTNSSIRRSVRPSVGERASV